MEKTKKMRPEATQDDPYEPDIEPSSEFDKVAKRLKMREKRAKIALEKKLDAVLQELKLDSDRKLSKSDARLILELLGIELNEYQKSELEATIERAHCFNANKLQSWIVMHKNFILYH